MKVGCTLPQSGALASPENLVRVAKRAEELGYDSVWVFERLLWPTNPRDPYPPSRDGSWPTSFQNGFDPIETLTFAPKPVECLKHGFRGSVYPSLVHVHRHELMQKWAALRCAPHGVIRHHVVGRVEL